MALANKNVITNTKTAQLTNIKIFTGYKLRIRQKIINIFSLFRSITTIPIFNLII